jgi:hypothetical protein
MQCGAMVLVAQMLILPKYGLNRVLLRVRKTSIGIVNVLNKIYIFMALSAQIAENQKIFMQSKLLFRSCGIVSIKYI